jgi:predicted DNA-binding protein (UPF0251 family)
LRDDGVSEASKAVHSSGYPISHEFAKEPPLVATRDDELGKPDEIDLEISRLAKLRTVDYEQIRREAAAKLSIRASILDKLVAAARPPDESAPGKGRPLELPAPEPWPEPVNATGLDEPWTTALRSVSLD